MLKVVVLADEATGQVISAKLQDIGCKVIAIFAPNDYDSNMQQKYKADLIVTNAISLSALTQTYRNDKFEPRQQIKAVTHQGVRLVPVANVFYFQAEHKYVTAYHTEGQLLIEDSLNSLEREFGSAFVRIHRKTLVAKNSIETLMKNDFGKYYIKLRGRGETLNVSRRQLSHVKKVLV